MLARTPALLIGLSLCLAGVSGCGSDSGSTTDDAAVVTAAPTTSAGSGTTRPAPTSAPDGTRPGSTMAGVPAESCEAAATISAMDLSASATFGEIVAAVAGGEITVDEAEQHWQDAVDEAEAQLPELQAAYDRLAEGAPADVATAIDLVSDETAALWELLRDVDLADASSLTETITASLGEERLNALVEAGTTMSDWTLRACGVDLNAG